jgi:hypothetical protein
LRTILNRVLRRINEPKRGKSRAGRINLHELHNFHSSKIIVRIIKSRRMRSVGHLVHMGEMRNA